MTAAQKHMPESIWVAPLAFAVVTMVAVKIFSVAQPLMGHSAGRHTKLELRR